MQKYSDAFSKSSSIYIMFLLRNDEREPAYILLTFLNVRPCVILQSENFLVNNSHCPRGVLRYFHTYVGSAHFFWVQNFEFQYFLGFQKNKYFLGYEDFVDILLGHHKSDYI